jgi:hypothetical protein
MSILGKKANNPKAIIPWAALQRRPDDFFDAQYLPEHVTLTEVSKMKSEHVHSCLSRWLEAQESGEQGFCFHSVAPGDLRKSREKRKLSEDMNAVSGPSGIQFKGKDKALPIEV